MRYRAITLLLAVAGGEEPTLLGCFCRVGVAELLDCFGSPQKGDQTVGIEAERPRNLRCILHPLLVARAPAEGKLADNSR
jgi:hypothetical protein